MEAPNLNRIPDFSRKHDKNRWADFIELSCFVSLDKEISLSDVIGRYVMEKYPSLSDGDEATSERRDQMEQEFISIFQYIDSRKALFGDYYPFENIDGDTIKVVDELDDRKVLYILLLCASNIMYFSKSTGAHFTTAFEQISAHILSLMYPNFQSEIFGTSCPPDSLFSGGTLLEKLKKLAVCCNTRLTEKAANNSRYRHPSGDAGLDVIAFLPLDQQDSIVSRIPICLGQCACSYEEWLNKQHAILTQYWIEKFETITTCHEFIFVPFPIRDVQGAWSPDDDDRIVVNVIDRVRIISILERYGNNLDFLKQNPIYCGLISLLQEIEITHKSN